MKNRRTSGRVNYETTPANEYSKSNTKEIKCKEEDEDYEKDISPSVNIRHNDSVKLYERLRIERCPRTVAEYQSDFKHGNRNARLLRSGQQGHRG